MNRLLKTDFKRLINSKLIFSIAIIICLITVFGIVFNKQFNAPDCPAEVNFLGAYLAFSQFSPMILGVVFVYTFSKDYSGGIDLFIHQLGYSPYKVLLSKSLALLIIVLPLTDLMTLLLYFFYGTSDVAYLLFILAIIDICIIYVLALSITISLIVRKALLSIMTLFVVILLCNIINIFCYGFASPSDSNSFTTIIARGWLQIPSSNPFTLNIDTFPYGVLLAILVPIAWILLFLAVDFVLIKRRQKL